MEARGHKITPKEKFLKQKIEYEADSDISKSVIKSQGVQFVLINDAHGAFYPVLTLNLSHFSYKSKGEF